MLPLVLVHGGGCGAWCWEPTLPYLSAPVCAVDLPPRSIRGVPPPSELPPEINDLRIADFADAVLHAADDAGIDRFVLAGHSLAGLTIPEVARRAPARVAHLVFVSALVPREGERAVDAMSPELIAKVSGGLTDDILRELMGNDLNDEQTRFMLDHYGTEAAPVMVERITRDGLPDALPKTFVRLARDASLTPGAQAASIAALGGDVTVVDIDAGHMVMISRPELLAPILDGIAAAAT